MAESNEVTGQAQWPEAIEVRGKVERLGNQLRRGLEEFQELATELRPFASAVKEVLATREAVRVSVAGLFDPGNEGKLNQLREMHADLVESLTVLNGNCKQYIHEELKAYSAAQTVRTIDEEAINRVVTKIESLIAEHKLLLTGDLENARVEWKKRTQDYVMATLVEGLGDMNVLHQLAEYIGRHISKLPELRTTLVRAVQASLSNEIRSFIEQEVQRRIPRNTEGAGIPDEMPPATVRAS